MTDATIGIRVRLDERAVQQLKALPDDLRQRFAELQKTLSTIPQGPAREAGLTALGGVRGTMAEGLAGGGVTPQQAKQIQQGLRTVNQAIRQALQERVALYKETRLGIVAEIDRLNKEVDQAMAQGERDRANALKGQIHAQFKALQGLGSPEALAKTVQEERQAAQRALGALGLVVGAGGLPVMAPPGTDPATGAQGGGIGPAAGRWLLGQGWAFARGLAGIGAIASIGWYAARRFQEAAGRELTVFDLARRMGMVEDLGLGPEGRPDFEAFRRAVVGVPYLAPDESLRAIAEFSGLAGRMGGFTLRPGPGGLPQGLAPQGALLGLGFGVGPHVGAHFFGQLARMGLTPNESEQRRLADLIGEAVVQGQLRSREGEVFDSLLDFLQLAMHRMAAAPNLQDLLQLQYRLAAAAPEGPERAGMLGALGMRVLGRAHEAIAGQTLFPGLPDLLRPLTFAALMRGGETDPFRMQDLVSQGLFGRLQNGRFLWEAILGEAEGMGLAQSPVLQLTLGQSMGLSPSLARRFFAMAREPGFRSILAQLPPGLLEDVAPQHQYRVMAELERAMGQMRRGPGTVGPEGIGVAGAPLTEAEIVAELTRRLQALQGAETTAEALQQAQAKIAQNLDATFQRLVPVLEKFTTAVEKITGWIERGAGWVGREGRTAGPDPFGFGVAPDLFRQAPKVGYYGMAPEAAPVADDPALRGLPPAVQQAIQGAAGRAGVDPALLAAIYRAEGEAIPFGIFDRTATGLEGKALASARIVAHAARQFQVATGRHPADDVEAFLRYLGHGGPGYAGYAPLGAENDPQGLNRHWVRNVSRIYLGREAAAAPGSFGMGVRHHVTFDPVPVIIRSAETGEVLGTAEAAPRLSPGEIPAAPAPVAE